MKKIIIAILVVFMLFIAGCANANKSIYDDRTKSLTNPGTDYNRNFTDDAKNFYPDYGIPNNNKYAKNLNNQYDNYFKTNNITNYKYTINGNTMRVWINNWDNMTEKAKNKIINDLKQFNRDIKNIVFVKTKNELD